MNVFADDVPCRKYHVWQGTLAVVVYRTMTGCTGSTVSLSLVPEKYVDVGVLSVNVDLRPLFSEHPCNRKEFKLYVSLNPDHMIQVLHGGLGMTRFRGRLRLRM